jgi:uncharacterized membrane protein
MTRSDIGLWILGAFSVFVGVPLMFLVDGPVFFLACLVVSSSVTVYLWAGPEPTDPP